MEVEVGVQASPLAHLTMVVVPLVLVFFMLWLNLFGLGLRFLINRRFRWFVLRLHQTDRPFAWFRLTSWRHVLRLHDTNRPFSKQLWLIFGLSLAWHRPPIKNGLKFVCLSPCNLGLIGLCLLIGLSLLIVLLLSTWLFIQIDLFKLILIEVIIEAYVLTDFFLSTLLIVGVGPDDKVLVIVHFYF